MTRPFSPAFKAKMVQRLVGSDAVSATQLSQETGIRQQTLSRWLLEARSVPAMPPSKKSPKPWSIADKARLVLEVSRLTGDELMAWLEREGVKLAELEQWRLALEQDGHPPAAATKQLRRLERELARKEKALAEAAALLVLKKKVDALWADEDDDTDDKSGA